MLNATILDNYLISEQVNENDLLTIYRGKDKQTNQALIATAVKPKKAAAEVFLARFKPMAKLIGKVDSPHIAKMLAFGEVNGQAVIVQESIEGKTLASMIAGGNGLPIDLVLDITSQLGEYLDALHKHGVIQVVFDPEDVLLSAANEIRVLNLGLAQGLNIGELLSTGKLKAAAYHAPELLHGGQGDARTDFYSLGAVLFQALTGKEPGTPSAAEQSLIEDFYPSRFRMGIPPEWDELVARCLHPNPGKRIQSAAEFLNKVEEIRRGMEVGAKDTILGMEDSLVGQTLGAYRLVERLGQGGMATVYKAYEAALDRYVAVKVLPQFFASDPNFAQRFRREAKAIAQLNHPNIIPIYSYGEQSGITYLVMQFVEGGTLKHERGEKSSPEDALRLLLPITRALGYAHRRGIVHRDIKPSNVLMAEGNWPMLADFGLAQMAESSMKLTGTGVGLGTPMYMSPEQGRGDKVDARTDIYSLGIMLYELVTGDVPFHADTPMAIVIKHMTAPMPMPRQVNPDIPEDVETIILKATSKSPDDRYQTAEEIVTAMERSLNRLSAAKPAEVVEEAKPKRAKPALAPAEKSPAAKRILKTALAALCGIVGLCLLGVILMGVFDICPPAGPWPQPPWCPGSPYKLPTFGGAEEPTPDWVQSFTEPILSEIANHPPNFEDNFESTEDQYDRWSNITGNVSFTSGVMKVIATDIWNGVDVPLSAEDFVLEFEFTPLTFNDSTFIITGFGNQLDQWYVMSIMPQTGQLEYIDAKTSNPDGTYTVIAEGKINPLVAGQKLTALVIAQGNQYATYIEGQPILYTTYDALLESAYAGLGVNSYPAGSSEVDFDNVRFWDLNNLAMLIRPTCASDQALSYTVQANDTLGNIATIFMVPVEAIREWNNLTSDSISPGQ